MSGKITAVDAEELTTGSMERKGWFFKTHLALLCGILNGRIEKEAESGGICATIKANLSSAKKYFPIMARLYEQIGYKVCYQIRYDTKNRFEVGWTSKYEICERGYDYHTQKKENTDVYYLQRTTLAEGRSCKAKRSRQHLNRNRKQVTRKGEW